VSSKSNQPLTDAELAQYEADRDLAADLLQAVRDMKAGKLHVVLSLVAGSLLEQVVGLNFHPSGSACMSPFATQTTMQNTVTALACVPVTASAV
jgi:hypothetical protein